MNKKIIILIVITICAIIVFTFKDDIGLTGGTEPECCDDDDISLYENEEVLTGNNCAGILASGTVVKDGRSIFWKQRHSSASGDEPRYYPVGYNNTGTVESPRGLVSSATYDLVMNQGTSWGQNSQGLSIGNFAQNGQLNNYHVIQNPDTRISYSYCILDALASCSTVEEAAWYIAKHGSSSVYGIISSQTGVAAAVSCDYLSGVGYIGHVYWVNNTWAVLNNDYWLADGDTGDSGKRATVTSIIENIIDNGGINGDHKIDWREIIQVGACNVRGNEQGTGTFTLGSSELCKYNGPSSVIAVAGDPTFDGVASVQFMAFGKCNGLFSPVLPLSVSNLDHYTDIPSFWWSGVGMFDDSEVKRAYASTGGTGTYDCERTREVWEWKHSAESWCLDAYDEWYSEFINDEYSTRASASASLNNLLYEESEYVFDNYVNEVITPSYTLENIPPTATIDSISPNPSAMGTTITFSGTGTDTDGTVTYYEWSSDIDGVFQDSEDCTTNSLSIGTHVIKYRVRDNENLWSSYDTMSLTIYAVPNIKPVATIDSIIPSSTILGNSVTFQGTGTDSDGIVTDYEWSSNLDGVFSTYEDCSKNTLSIGTHIISYRVKDNDEDWSLVKTSSLTITPIPNTPPVAHIDSITPNPITVGNSVTFVGSGEDTDGSISAYDWDSNIDNQLSTSSTFSTTDLTVGTHIISFRVRDNDNDWSPVVTNTLIVNRIPNIPPIATINSISPISVVRPEVVYFDGSGEDQDGTITAYEWTSSIDGVFETRAKTTYNAFSVGEHVIIFRVQDNDGEWSAYKTGPTLTVTEEVEPLVECWKCENGLAIKKLFPVGTTCEGDWSTSEPICGSSEIPGFEIILVFLGVALIIWRKTK